MDKRKKSDLLENLKGLYKKGQRGAPVLEDYTVPVLRQLIKAEEATWTCRCCGAKLTVLKWNNEADIIACNNFACDKYHSPVETILK